MENAITHRFSAISTAPPDAILGLTEAFQADPNPEKMNLTVGVYKDESGQTPILKSVKLAEEKLLAAESSKGYLPIDGTPEYRELVHDLVFGKTVSKDRIAILQSPGGTGALRVAADFMQTQLPAVRIWVPNPTWANHQAVFTAAGLPVETYRYLGDDRTSLDLDGMLDALKTQTREGDAVLLHGCCHNPTGVDPTTDQWHQIATVIEQKQLLPLIDFAYQGFGDGLESDAAGMRQILSQVDEAIVCSSFSKNFGLYSERVGAIALVAASSEARDAARSQLKRVVRTNFSNPPRHGGSIVSTILSDANLREQWESELTSMRDRINRLRNSFVEKMSNVEGSSHFEFLRSQRGMFSFSGLTPMQVDELKTRFGIYIVGSGRVNVAGIAESKMEYLCNAIATVRK
ncbi:MAG: amino acid aminotransferase [Planctomycetota bacterium]